MNYRDEERCYAYALGYHAAQSEGCDENPYRDGDDRRHYYRAGYDRGVADYCELTHPEEAV